MHVVVAEDALKEISEVTIERRLAKRGKLTTTWYIVSLVPGIAGIALLLKHYF